MGIRKTAILLAAVMLSAYAPAWAVEAYDTRIEQAFVNMPEIEAVVYAADGAENDVSAALDGMKLETVQIEPASALPTDYYFILDISGSINKKAFDGIKAGLKEWRGRIGTQDSFTLITFGDEIRIVLNGEESGRVAAGRIDGLEASDKKTRLFDGMSEAVKLASMNKNAGRRLLLLLTDGRDFSEGGSTTKNEIDKLLNKADVPLYAFGIGSSKENLDSLGEMARGNGGDYYNASKDAVSAMNIAFANISSAKVMRFSTGSNIADGTEKRLEISCGGSTDEVSVRADRWIADMQAPTVEKVEFADDMSVMIQFSEPVTGADVISSFTLLGKNHKPMEIPSVSYDDAANTAILHLAKAVPNGEYKLNITGVQDVSMEKNPLEQTEYALEMTDGKTEILGLPTVWFVVIAIAAAALIITAIVIAAKRKRKKLEEKKKPPIVTPPVWSGKRVTLTITGQNGLRRTATVLIGESGFIIGRSAAQNSGIDLNIEDDMYISRRQCRLAYRDGEMIISNLSETNITKLNGKPIPVGGCRLADGDDIEIGQTRIVASIDWGCNEMALS